MSIGTHPVPEINLEQELRLVKAALLYADKIKLYSLNSLALMSMVQLGDLNTDEKLDFVELIAPHIASPENRDEISAFFNKLRSSSYDRRTQRSIAHHVKPFVDASWKEIEQVTQQMADQARFHELKRAVDEGILQVHTFELFKNKESRLSFIVDCVIKAKSPVVNTQQSTEPIISEFVETISQTISDFSTFPLFDHPTGRLIELGIKEDKISISDADINRGKQSGLAGNLLEQLPLFEQATIDEVIDIRRELEKYLIRFRKAILEFSESMKTASWGKDFPSEANHVFIKNVAPAIQEIEEKIKTNKYLATLARKLVDKPLTMPSGAVLSVVMSHLNSIPEVVSNSLGPALASTALVYDTFKEWKDKKRKVESHSLFFYYQARARLNNQ